MGAVSVIGNRKRKGTAFFLLIFFLLILEINLMAVAVNYGKISQASLETDLKDSLYHLKKGLEKFKTGRGDYPSSLEEMSIRVAGKPAYVRRIPPNPFRKPEEFPGWEFELSENQKIKNVRVSGDRVGLNGTSYKDWGYDENLEFVLRVEE